MVVVETDGMTRSESDTRPSEPLAMIGAGVTLVLSGGWYLFTTEVSK